MLKIALVIPVLLFLVGCGAGVHVGPVSTGVEVGYGPPPPPPGYRGY